VSVFGCCGGRGVKESLGMEEPRVLCGRVVCLFSWLVGWLVVWLLSVCLSRGMASMCVCDSNCCLACTSPSVQTQTATFASPRAHEPLRIDRKPN
jgi:hypothetical protein